MRTKKKINVTVDIKIHNQIREYFKEIGEDFNLSAAVQEVERGILQGILKHQELAGIESSTVRAKATAGLVIADAFQDMFSDFENASKKDV